jgi:hypothetical protein
MKADVPFPDGTSLIILRHADRAGENLNEKGIARSQALVTALEGTPVDAIYSRDIQRNLDTAAPLAEARGLEVQIISDVNPTLSLMKAGAGKSIVWVGNKGNLNTIWETLMLPGSPPLEYGDLYTVSRSALGRPSVSRQQFGAEVE